MRKLKKIELPVGEDDRRIKPEARYLAKIDDEWVTGYFEKEWYGWNFSGVYDAGYQVDYDGWEELYEIIEE